MTDTKFSRPLPKKIRQWNSISLRTKILLGNLLIVLITVAAMGYFVFYRSQVANKFLTDQFDISVTREIENRLQVIVSGEVNDISIFFSSMKNVIDTFGSTTTALLSTDSTINLESTNWNPYLELKQLPNGNWDNSNTELSSIFLPPKVGINDNIANELVALKGLDYFVQGLMGKNPDVIAIYFGGKAGETVYYPNVDLASILPPEFNITERPWYVDAIEISPNDGKPVWSAPYQDAALNGLVITTSIPVYDESGAFRGVAALDLKLATITEHVSNLVIGKTGYGFLIDPEGRLIAMPSQGLKDFNLTENDLQNGNLDNLSLINRVPLNVFEVLAKMTSGQTGVKLVEINGSNRYIAYEPIPIVGYSLGVIVSEDELLQGFVETNTILETEIRQTVLNAVGVIFILLSISGLASYGIGTSITAPLGKLTAVAKQVAAGNLNATAKVTTQDEIGILGNTLNSMSATAKNLVANLEERVWQRTQIIERRMGQIQAVAEIGKAVAAQRDIEELLTMATHLISNRFGYYHVGIFLLDLRNEFAILMAANSMEGQKMLEHEHKLRVGAEGIVGTVASSGEARIALDVGKDAVYFDNPYLPQTRSEMALPLIAGGEVQGVLDIQSMEAGAFSEDDIPTLQILADQLAIAVQNVRMIRDTQEALFAARKASGEISQQGWQSLLKDTHSIGYVAHTHGEVVQVAKGLDDDIRQVLDAGNSVTSDDQLTVNIPVIVRGQTIGALRLTKTTDSGAWSNEEINEVESLANEISNTLESARLYRDAQQRAIREQTMGEIVSNITAATEMDDIMRETVAQLGKTFSDMNVSLRIKTKWD